MIRTNNILHKKMIWTATTKKSSDQNVQYLQMSSTLLDFGDKFITKFGELFTLLLL